jgi:hypothetical protein
MRWLLGWQHLAPQTQLAGEEGVLQALISSKASKPLRSSGSARCCRRASPTTIRAGSTRFCLSGASAGAASRRIRPGLSAMGRAAPRHPHQRRAHHVLRARVRRLAAARACAAVGRREHCSMQALSAPTPSRSARCCSSAAPASQRPAAHHRPHPRADRPRAVGACHRRPRRRRRLRPAARHDGPAPQVGRRAAPASASTSVPRHAPPRAAGRCSQSPLRAAPTPPTNPPRACCCAATAYSSAICSSANRTLPSGAIC